jgi:hypothetical protein
MCVAERQQKHIDTHGETALGVMGRGGCLSIPDFSSSARASCAVLPLAKASHWAKKFDAKMSWCFPFDTGFWVVTGSKKSHGMTLVP